jgi:hypothetical protein
MSAGKPWKLAVQPKPQPQQQVVPIQGTTALQPGFSRIQREAEFVLRDITEEGTAVLRQRSYTIPVDFVVRDDSTTEQALEDHVLDVCRRAGMHVRKVKVFGSSHPRIEIDVTCKLLTIEQSRTEIDGRVVHKTSRTYDMR